MKDIADITACVIDTDEGLFFPVAERLARDYKQVYYQRPGGQSFRTVANVLRAEGNPAVSRIDDFWPIKKQIDLFVFPDCADPGLQQELVSQGFPVWGSRNGCELELVRGKILDVLETVGLPSPKTKIVRGLTNLRKYLDKASLPQFVKISYWRGDCETFQATDKYQVSNKCDLLAMKWGPLKEKVTFYVQPPIDTPVEAGIDSYFVNGQWPDKVVLGYERKSLGYFATVKDREDVAPELWNVNEALTPVLAGYGYTNFFSSEVRDGKLLDPTCRVPSPAGEEQLEIYGNLPEIMYRGALGELVQPQIDYEFCGEAIIAHTGDRDAWKSVSVPKSVSQWVKLYAAAYDDGAYHFPPAQDPECIGCIVGVGDSPDAVVEHLKEIQEAMKDQPVNINVSALAELLPVIEQGEKEGIPFSDDPLPEPAAVLDTD